ncbi:hypothetical protein [Herbaspirillum sp. SJZ107]|uniref:hypothetical protein n=1 Tax=Herbaspirillum sp. SJZ107 TaxID=2572881 RepID=UPI001154295B|nr:hypothetical protein [Herbaspirillum sp. SJZ107]TQK10259.1 hypothetical protein FBX97_0175 [Herbaspirillum sp. SJZ107]
MATVVNFIDTTLQAAAARTVNLPTADIQLLPSAPLFKANADGSITPESITFTATLIDLDAPLTFNATGAPLSSPTAKSVTVVGAAMTGSSVTVIASATVNGRTYTKPCTITKVQDGVDGSTTYTWIKYADSAAGAGLSDDPTGKAYIGLAYNKPSPIESTIASDYTWSLIKGTDGQPGPPGEDGAQLYTWIKYADYANGDGMYDLPTANTLYIGISVNKTTATESNNPADYVWSRFKGDQGVPGPALYTWIKYGDSAAGAGLSDDPTNKAYIGFAYNKTTPVESENPADYTWSLNQGGQGVPGQPGKDGTTYYTWIKYADVPDGTGLYDVPTDSTVYIGIAVNKVTATESTNKADYTWSRFKGGQGVPGNPGQPGQRGTVDISAGTAGSVWSDSEATAAIAQTGYGVPQMLDVVTLYNQAAGFASTRYWNGSAWIPVAQVINGSLLVKNTVAADKIDTRGLSIKDTQGGVILAAGSALDPAYAAPGTLNSALVPSITAAQNAATAAADMNLIARGACTVLGNTATKALGSAAGWNSDVYSKEGYAGGVTAKVTIPKATGYDMFFGLNSDPAADGSYTSLDYALHIPGGGTVEYWESGSLVASLGSMSDGDVLEITYNGSRLRCTRNGLQMRDVALSTAAVLYFDSSFSTPGATMTNIRFAPMSDVSAGVAALAAVNDPTLGLAQRLRSNAQNLMSGGAALTVGSLVTDGSGQRVSGYGLGFTSYGLVAYNSAGAPTITVNGATGAIAVAGDLSGSTGTFGAVRVGVSLATQATGYNSDAGIWQGMVNGVPKMSMVAPGGAKILFDPSASQQIQLVNVGVASSFSATLVDTTGAYSYTVSKSTSGSSYAGTYKALPVNGSGNYTYSWSVSNTAGVNCWLSATNAQQVVLTVTGNNLVWDQIFTLTCIVSDVGGNIVKTINVDTTVSFS